MALSEKQRTDPLLGGPNVVRVTPQTSNLVDQNGRPLSFDDEKAFGPPKDPLRDADKDRIAGVVHRDAPIVLPSFDWEVPQVKRALASHDAGFFVTSSQLCDAMLSDDRVQAALGSRLGGLFSQDMVITPANDSDAAREVAEAWALAFPRCAPHSTLSEIQRWAVMMAFAPTEVLWDTDNTEGGYRWQPYLKPWHPQHFAYRWDLRRYVAYTMDGVIEIEPGDGRWFVVTPHGMYRGWIHGAVRALAIPWLARVFARRDWLRFNERHGEPIIKAFVPAMGDAEQRKAFIETLPTIGQETVVMLPKGVDGQDYDLDMLEATDRAWEAFPGLIAHCNDAITLTLLWQNLTTEVKEGSFAAARVHADVRQAAIQFDEQTLSEALYQVSRPFAELNFGDASLAPRTRWIIKPVEDRVAKSQSFVNFALGCKSLADAGKTFDVERLARSLEIDVHDVEDAPVPKAPAAPGGETETRPREEK